MRSEADANPGTSLPAPEGEGTLFDWPKNTGRREAVLHAMELSLARRRRRRRQAQSLAALVLVLGVGLLWRAVFHGHAPVSPGASPLVSTPVRQTLADGSTAELREGAEISVEYGPDVRLVKILRGEVYFDVVKETSRNFVVRAAGVEVQAVGTEFAVGVGQTSVEVLVTQGRVAIRPASDATVHDRAASPSAVLVDAGYRLTTPLFDAQNAGSAEPLSPGKIDERLTWRIPRLQFSGTPLHEAVEVINRHSGIQLTLADADLGAVRLSGSIRADNVDALLALLEADHAVEANYTGERQILLRRRR